MSAVDLDDNKFFSLDPMSLDLLKSTSLQDSELTRVSIDIHQDTLRPMSLVTRPKSVIGNTNSSTGESKLHTVRSTPHTGNSTPRASNLNTSQRVRCTLSSFPSRLAIHTKNWTMTVLDSPPRLVFSRTSRGPAAVTVNKSQYNKHPRHRSAPLISLAHAVYLPLKTSSRSDSTSGVYLEFWEAFKRRPGKYVPDYVEMWTETVSGVITSSPSWEDIKRCIELQSSYAISDK